MELRILGPLEAVTPGGEPIELGTPKQRAVLALLATRPGRVVPIHALVDELWADEPPERAIASLQAYVSRLRRVLEPGRSSRGRATILVSRAPGYLVDLPPEAVDATRFTAGVQNAPDDPDALSDTLALWRGDPLPELGDSPLAQAERARLQELRFAAIERRSAAWLARDRLPEVIYTTEAALAESPYREPLWSQLILALRLHARAARALQASGAGATAQAAHLRLALPVAGPLEVAPVLAAAAGEAYERTAHEEAVALLEEAAAVLLTAPPSQRRDVAELDLRVRLAYTHQAIGDYLGAPARAQYALMEPVLHRVQPAPELFAALWGYASFHTADGDFERAAAIAPLDRIVADVHAGYAAHQRADLHRARELLQGALDALPPGGLPVFPIIDWDPVAGILGPAASAESLLGHRAAAEAHLARATRATPFQDMYVTHYAAVVAADAYDAGAVLELGRRTLRLAEQIQSREYRAMAQVLLGWAGGDEALLAEGEDALGGTLWRYSRLLPMRPDLLLRAGRRDEAAALARERLRTPLDGLNRFAEPDLRRVLGAATGDRAELQRALTLARDLGHAAAAGRIARTGGADRTGGGKG